ncbi:MAG TPA: NYN domain-containing protein [Leptospiraceae bacterium]|nr:NYN domain-containing protein [Leptospiraceae bacterium]HMY66278.1 NYN domain-containing protein [Leptospiraceae bacterium]HMZ60123.1 NYN domain-containing protein [Leptospiraceae bacterium]HNF15100.1 NYN domain-containing protein [Leptospiraceae bacterium]HNF23457.1 NYN domain-containing protein [Leptospiraceae bacterium]
MRILIDGFNLIYKFPDLEGLMYESRLNLARQGLLQILHRYSGAKKNTNILVVFDGKKDVGSPVEKETFGDIRVYYSHDLTADHCIKSVIRNDRVPANIYVVSSDKEILRYAKNHGCKFFTSEEFSGMIGKELHSVPEEPERDRPLAKEEVAEWMEIFRRKRNAE